MYREDPPELVFRQSQQGLEIEVSGTLSFYEIDAPSRSIGELVHATFENSDTLVVLAKSRWDPYIVWMKRGNGDIISVNLQDQGDDVSISGLSLIDLPTIDAEFLPDPTAEEVVQSFQESPIGTIRTFPIAQDPMTTEIIQFGVRNTRYRTIPDFRHPGTDFSVQRARMLYQ